MEINKTVIVASRWFLYYLTYVDDARSNTNQVGFLSLGKDGLRMLENGVLKRIWGCRMKEVTGGWAKLYIEKLHDVDSSVISMINEEV